MKTHIIVTVLLPDSFREPQEWTIKIPLETSIAVMNREEIAETIFKISNAPPEFLSLQELELLKANPRTGIRSVSVGDVIIIDMASEENSRQVCTVRGCGFKFY
jgi:hypothetical protein